MADNLYDFDNNGLARAYKDCKWALFDRCGNQVGEWYSYIEEWGEGFYKIEQGVKNILVLRNAFEKTRKQMKVNALSINALSDNLNFPMFAKLTLKKT